MSKFIPIYDLESLTEEQRMQYVTDLCAHLKVPDNLNLVMLGYLDDRTGPRRLVAFVKRGATEIIRKNNGIDIINVTHSEVRGSFVVTATAKDKDNHQEVAIGSKFIANLSGIELDDAIMTADTRAKQRVTLQFVGAGVLDESEVNPKEAVQLKNTTPIAVNPTPSVQISDAPGKDVTGLEDQKPIQEKLNAHMNAALASTHVDHTTNTVTHVTVEQEKQAAFEAQQAKMREDAIAQLNEKFPNPNHADPAPAKKPRAPRKSKTVSFDQVPATTTQSPAPVAEPPVATPPTPAAAIEQPAPITATPPAAVQVAPPTQPTKRLTPEEIKPFRQRQFRLITDLELAGFAPKEGMGNLDKMKNFVSLMFPDVTNFNELSIVEWEKYLTVVETKLKAEGAAATISYIEQAIGI